MMIEAILIVEIEYTKKNVFKITVKKLSKNNEIIEIINDKILKLKIKLINVIHEN